MKKREEVSGATLKRLPIYLRYLLEKEKEGAEHISSVQMAEDLRLNSVQVKKDIAAVSTVEGKPKVGFLLSKLVEDLEAFLGFDNSQEAILIGVGKLGKALLGYSGFAKYGLTVRVGFDVDESLCGESFGGATVKPMREMRAYVKRRKIRMAILAVRRAQAQSVADELAKAGILAILNFAPVQLSVPRGVAVQDVDIAASLAILSTKLKMISEGGVSPEPDEEA